IVSHIIITVIRQHWLSTNVYRKIVLYLNPKVPKYGCSQRSSCQVRDTANLQSRFRQRLRLQTDYSALGQDGRI
ncbi:hypothetical protein N0Y54_31200, partial [Nostoc punctiforme UO1]|uniref:hypothetical protein n=1 Tax=Nostoc punctiforme TaxID=272131 RepID=UPI00309E59C8